jgi:cyclophilin family peptidyl-prolyl cis-trans isomerase
MRKILFLILTLFSLTFVIQSCGNQVVHADDVKTSDVQYADNSDTKALEALAQNDNANDTKETKVRINTTMGFIEVKLYNETPKHRDNFIKLVDSAFFDKTLFHRVIKGFMIQGGDPDSRNAPAGTMLGNGGPGYTIPAEFLPQKYFHKRGALAAAREGDQVNPTKASSGSQFYIVQGQVFTDSILNLMEAHYKIKFSPEQRKAYTTVGGAPHLDGSYTVFGEVYNGMEVVDRIAAVPVDRNARPLTDVRMTSIEIIE